MGQELLQSGYGYLLQMGYYKVGQVLQSSAVKKANERNEGGQ